MKNLILNLEKAKTLIIVVLFITTMLLLYFLWQDGNLKKISFPVDLSVYNSNEASDIPSAIELITPMTATVSFGTENYTEYTAQSSLYWNNFLQEYKKFAASENIFLKEINKTQWDETMHYKSIHFTFESAVPFTPYFERLEMTKIPLLDSIAYLSSIGYSLASPESMFIYDGVNQKYYSLISDSDHTDLKKLITSLEKTNYEKCYPIDSLFGVKNNTLLPLVSKSNLSGFTYLNELSVSQMEKSEFTETFFGESYDFVRKITEENGITMYMYGYSQKLLTIKPNGIFEYKEELNISENTGLNYFDSLDCAILFISSHGGWHTLKGNSFTPYLRHAEEIEVDKKKGFRFHFGLKENGFSLYYENSSPITIDVIGNQVTYYKRYILTPTSDVVSDSSFNVFPINQILPQSYALLQEILSTSTNAVSASTPDEIFSSIAEKITSVSMGYYKGKSSNIFTPAWIIKFNNINVYYDLYSGEYLGNTTIAKKDGM